MILDIKLTGYKLEQGEDHPYQDQIKVSASNHIDQEGMMVLEIEGSEYHFDEARPHTRDFSHELGRLYIC